MGNIESEDDGLWSRSLKGEGEAFGVLFDRHRDRVFRHAFRLARDRHNAEDIMSTAFLELWRRRGKVRLVEGSILPWLLVTTTNIARNSRRAAFRYSSLLRSLPRNDEAFDATSDGSYMDDAVDINVALALGTLNTTDLQLVSLVVFEEYTLSAAAAVLNLTRGAAKTRMHRARLRMKAAIYGAAGATPATVVERERP
ncbi:sigma-70 family RNA polymerase sigma factor [Arthrobacter sp. UYEF20]|uniref:RNA polymerase sigma factor n=1 Tax=Arthrobacter sp. UYEF20 TaxID=1756363 RepID=UPI00339B14D1